MPLWNKWGQVHFKLFVAGTQGALHAKSPLEPHGAATSNVILHSEQYLRRSSNEGTSMCHIAFAIIHDGNTWILCFTPAFEEADLALVEAMSFLMGQKLFARYYTLLLPSTPNPISAIQPPTSNGRPRPETGRRGLPLFMDDKSAGIVGYASLFLNVSLSWALWGLKRGAERSFPFRVVATATPDRE